MINSEKFEQLALIMQGFTRPWFIAGGWTIDLALDRITREHKDIDLCIFRKDLAYTLNYFKNWTIQVAVPGEHFLRPVQNLDDLKPPRERMHLFYGNEFLDIFVANQINDQVVFPRNNQIQLALAEFSRGSFPQPFLNPAWELLFKSLDPREEDEHDFIVYKELMDDPPSKKWLLASMIMVNGSPKWITELAKNLSHETILPID